MFIIALFGLLLVFMGWSDVAKGEFGLLAIFSIVVTFGLVIMYIIPGIYRHNLKKKVRAGDLTNEEAFNKVSKYFGMSIAVVVYVFSFDEWFINKKF